MIRLSNDFSIKCNKCGKIHNIESIKHDLISDKDERDNCIYVLSDRFHCLSCNHLISYKFVVTDDMSFTVRRLEGGLLESNPLFEKDSSNVVIEVASVPYDRENIDSIYQYAKRLVGMTFSDVYAEYRERHPAEIDVDVFRETNSRGLLGNFIEKYYFEYNLNSDQRPDFEVVGVEVKQTCFDLLKNGGYTAGERLSITKIAYDKPVEKDFYKSHVWAKIQKILLIHYLRDKTKSDKLDYKIQYVNLFTPPKEDLKIIREDYQKIISKIEAGKAHELSESDTLYLGAATKGRNAKDLVEQYYGDHTKAMTRGFCLKKSYMNYVLNTYVLKDAVPCEYIISTQDKDENKTFEDIVLEKLFYYRDKKATDKSLCEEFHIEYSNNNKSLWSNLAFRMLGIKSNRAEEFVRANVVVKAIRVEEDNTINESMSFPTIDFNELAKETWESSEIYSYFSETRFLLVVYKREHDAYRFINAKFWNMNQNDLEIVRVGWTAIRDKIIEGVKFRLAGDRVYNDIPGKNDNAIIHMRPHTSFSAYSLENGFCKGDIESDACQLPDGQWMTKQCFWLNNDYILSIIREDLQKYGEIQ